MQNQAKYNAVLHAAHLLLKAMPQAAEQYGVLLNKSPNSVRNELNPNLPGHKLGVLEALEMMNYSQAYGLLYQLCAACGFVAVPMPRELVTDHHLIDVLCRWQSSVGGACQTICEALEDNIVTPSEFNRISGAANVKMGNWFVLQERLRKESEKCHGH
ncbi:phage regulatory CII family protein [uncultured Alteromonas sp.]|jgi:hypothetical protein|uniref:phage regulatory CII family protein n=1 Tax=uncultured Alteromonas sp. TaxID=179113 RepID=UPI0025ECA305|nr:phage regulatory CII family protein [uncultured Alteromonas sp.]